MLLSRIVASLTPSPSARSYQKMAAATSPCPRRWCLLEEMRIITLAQSQCSLAATGGGSSLIKKGRRDKNRQFRTASHHALITRPHLRSTASPPLLRVGLRYLPLLPERGLA